MNKEELAAKAEWEGGTLEYIMGYGCSPENLPPNAPSAVKAAWKRLYEMRGDVDLINRWLFSD